MMHSSTIAKGYCRDESLELPDDSAIGTDTSPESKRSGMSGDSAIGMDTSPPLSGPKAKTRTISLDSSLAFRSLVQPVFSARKR
jgi:hypothetical protein